MPHIYIAISSHGFGHLAQCTPVLHALKQRHKDLKITIRSMASDAVLRDFLSFSFEHIQTPHDLGMLMESALTVLRNASHEAYQAFHAGFADKVADEARQLSALAPTLVLTNTSYLMSAAARQAGIPSLHLCSLNWGDMYSHYCADFAGSNEITQAIYQAYNQAEAYLILTPGMPMPEINNTIEMSPIARTAKPNKRTLKFEARLANKKLVMVTLGGIPFQFDLQDWPKRDDIVWLFPQQSSEVRADFTTLDEIGMNYIEALTHADALITKPGYGSFAEAGLIGLPTLYMPRGDWPEEPYLIDWISRQTAIEKLSTPIDNKGVLEKLDQVIADRARFKQHKQSSGTDQVVEFIEQYL